MSDVATPSFGRRLRFTPMRDLVRGRVTGRLDWHGRVRAMGLPEDVSDRVLGVVHRTGLWRTEKADVAAELVAHFQDGLAAGGNPGTLVADFGDARAAAKLIRRAKRRQRPLAWHVARVAGWGAGGLVVLYAVSLAQFILGRPTPTVDYVAKLNAPGLAVPERERALPIYRDAMTRLYAPTNFSTLGYPDPDAARNAVVYASPASGPWPMTAAWLRRNADALAELRRAAAMPTLGPVLGPPRNGETRLTPVYAAYTDADNRLLGAAGVLRQDARLAARDGDAARLVADVNALLGIARHTRTAGCFTRYACPDATVRAVVAIEDALQADPAAVSDAEWKQLAHAQADLGPNPAIDTTYDDAAFADLLQYVYTDDGHGDGRPTKAGLRRVEGPASSDPKYAGSWIAQGVARGAPVAILGAVTWFDSRAAVRDGRARLAATPQAQLAKPMREADWSAFFAIEDGLLQRGVGRSWLAGNLGNPTATPNDQRRWESVLGYRDGGDGRDDGGEMPFDVGKDPYDSTLPWPLPRDRMGERSSGDWRLYPRPDDPDQDETNPPSQPAAPATNPVQ